MGVGSIQGLTARLGGRPRRTQPRHPAQKSVMPGRRRTHCFTGATAGCIIQDEQWDGTMTETPASEFLVLHEIIRAAHGKLEGELWDYVTGSTGTETTQRRNRLALDRIGLRPRVLRDVSHIDPSAEFLGHRIRLPVLLAPGRRAGVARTRRWGGRGAGRRLGRTALLPQLGDAKRAGGRRGGGQRPQALSALRPRWRYLRRRPCPAVPSPAAMTHFA